MGLAVATHTIVPSTELSRPWLQAMAETAALHINYEAQRGNMNRVEPDDLTRGVGWFALSGSLLIGHVRLVETDGSLRLSSLWVAEAARENGVAGDLADTAVGYGINHGRRVETVTRKEKGVGFFKVHGFTHDPANSPEGKFLMVHTAVAGLALSEHVA